MNTVQNYKFTDQDLNIITEFVDITLRQTGINYLQSVNKLQYELINGVVKVEDNNKIISLSQNSVNIIRLLADINLKTDGLSSFDKVLKIMYIIKNPIPIEKEVNVEHAVLEEQVDILKNDPKNKENDNNKSNKKNR